MRQFQLSCPLNAAETGAVGAYALGGEAIANAGPSRRPPELGEVDAKNIGLPDYLNQLGHQRLVP